MLFSMEMMLLAIITFEFVVNIERSVIASFMLKAGYIGWVLTYVGQVPSGESDIIEESMTKNYYGLPDFQDCAHWVDTYFNRQMTCTGVKNTQRQTY